MFIHQKNPAYFLKGNSKMTMNLNVREKILEYVRVLKITKRPTREEFTTSMKVTGAGIAIIGVIGLMVYFIAYYSKLFS